MQPNLSKKAKSKQHQQNQTELAGSVEGTNRSNVTATEIAQFCIYMCRQQYRPLH
jgi:hypothetical protein